MRTIHKSALIHIENRKLMAVISHGKSVPGFPGGKPEGEETPEEALARELNEELGVILLPKTVEFIGTFEAPALGDDTTMIKCRCYAGEYDGEPQPCGEIREIVWLTSVDRAGQTPVTQLVLDALVVQGRID